MDSYCKLRFFTALVQASFAYINIINLRSRNFVESSYFEVFQINYIVVTTKEMLKTAYKNVLFQSIGEALIRPNYANYNVHMYITCRNSICNK